MGTFSIRYPTCGTVYHMGNAWFFPINSYSIELREPWKLVPYFPRIMGTFLPSDSHPMVYFITWETHGFPNRFPIAWDNVGKPTL